MTSKKIENGLTSLRVLVRHLTAERMDFTPTPEQIERGLTDHVWTVRFTFAERADFTPTLKQFKRGLKDQDVMVREVFQKRQAEWQAKWEAAELKKRHATAIQKKPKLEAL